MSDSGPHASGMGLPALDALWIGIAIIWGLVVLWVLRLQHAPMHNWHNRTGEAHDQPPRVPA